MEHIEGNLNKNIYYPMLSLDDFHCEFACITGGSKSLNGLYKTYETVSAFYSRNIIFEADEADINSAVAKIVKDAAEGKPALTSYTKELVCEGAEKLFEQNGFKTMLVQHGMVFDTGKPFDETFCPQVVRINSAKIDEWNEVMLRGFGTEKQPEPETYRAIAKDSNIMVYAYVENGVILGTAMMLLNKENSGIHEVAVPPENRHKGIAKKMILKALKDAKAFGCKTVSLQASDEGRFVYKSIGFEEYSQIYTWERR